MNFQNARQRADGSEMAMSPKQYSDFDSGDDEEDPLSKVKYFSNFVAQGGHIKKWYSI